jgi:hypothetical protein
MRAKIVVQFTETEEAKALPILLRHSPGTILRERTYVVDLEVALALKKSGVHFQQLSREVETPSLAGVGSGERV